MPEGDAIFRYAIRLRADLIDAPLEELTLRHRGEIEAARGRPVTAITTRGKHTLIHIATDVPAAVHVHLGMNGVWRRARRGAPRRGGVDRPAVILATVACEWRCHRPMHAEILEGAAIDRHRPMRRLGPDLLGDDLDEAEILRRAREGHRARLPIADVLLDQSVACGIGTIYRSETLFVARQNPWTPLAALDDERLLEIYRIARRLLSMNLVPGRETRTTSPDDRRPAAAELDPPTYVYTREGEPCLVCGAAIEVRRHSEQARKTYFCRRCQIEEPRRYRSSRTRPDESA